MEVDQVFPAEPIVDQVALLQSKNIASLLKIARIVMPETCSEKIAFIVYNYLAYHRFEFESVHQILDCFKLVMILYSKGHLYQKDISKWFKQTYSYLFDHPDELQFGFYMIVVKSNLAQLFIESLAKRRCSTPLYDREIHSHIQKIIMSFLTFCVSYGSVNVSFQYLDLGNIIDSGLKVYPFGYDMDPVLEEYFIKQWMVIYTTRTSCLVGISTILLSLLVETNSSWVTPQCAKTSNNTEIKFCFCQNSKSKTSFVKLYRYFKDQKSIGQYKLAFQQITACYFQITLSDNPQIKYQFILFPDHTFENIARRKRVKLLNLSTAIIPLTIWASGSNINDTQFVLEASDYIYEFQTMKYFSLFTVDINAVALQSSISDYFTILENGKCDNCYFFIIEKATMVVSYSSSIILSTENNPSFDLLRKFETQLDQTKYRLDYNVADNLIKVCGPIEGFRKQFDLSSEKGIIIEMSGIIFVKYVTFHSKSSVKLNFTKNSLSAKVISRIK